MQRLPSEGRFEVAMTGSSPAPAAYGFALRENSIRLLKPSWLRVGIVCCITGVFTTAEMALSPGVGWCDTFAGERDLERRHLGIIGENAQRRQ